MCSRYYRKSDKQKIAEAFHVRGDLSSLVLAPTNYNVAPVTFQSVVCNGKETGERELVLMRWGLIPFFAKSEEQYKDLSTINAKADNLTKSNMWREPFKRHRCLVPADGLYEWPKPGHLISTTYDPAPTVETDAEVTTAPNELLATIQDRLALILHPRDYDRWLANDEADPRLPLDLLHPFASRLATCV
jgi:putative SOS response-associated peptidase YedK